MAERYVTDTSYMADDYLADSYRSLLRPKQPTDSYELLLRSNTLSETNTLTGGMDIYGLRPKSFLHDEMDEFNLIFSELAKPKSSKLKYLASDLNDTSMSSSFSSSDECETPIARLSPPPTDKTRQTDVDLSIVGNKLAVLSPNPAVDLCDNRLYISEDTDGAAATCCNGDGTCKPVEAVTCSTVMRRSLSCAETSVNALLLDCDSRLYGSLTSGVRVHNARRSSQPTSSSVQQVHSGNIVSSQQCKPSRSLENCLNEVIFTAGIYKSLHSKLLGKL